MSKFSRESIIKPNEGNASEGWQQEDNLPLEDNIKFISNDNATYGTYALNSVASPFARRFATISSFEYCTDRKFNEVSLPFRIMVSDVLDVIELLFNYEVNKDYLEITKCNLTELRFPGNPSFQDLIAADAEKTVYFILYKNRVLAASSHKTLFYTNCRIDDWLKEEGSFFGNLKLSNGDPPFYRKNDPRDLTVRPENFQKYMLWLKDHYSCGNTAIGKFIARQLTDINSVGIENQLEPLSLGSGVPFVINNITLHYTKQIQGQNLILDGMLDIGCEINRKFVLMENKINCLLPINIDELNKFQKPLDSLNEIKYSLFDIVSIGEYKSYIMQYKKEDVSIPIMDIGIYPFYKYPEGYFKPNQNDDILQLSMQSAYNIILAYKEKANEQNEVDLEFYRLASNGKLEKIPKHDGNNTIGVIKIVRTKKEVKDEKFTTVHYAIYGTNLELIKITVNGKSGLLRPKMKEYNLNRKDEKIKFAVDFGTTTTYIAYKEGDNKIRPLETESQSMVFLHSKPDGDKMTASVYERSASENLASVIDLIKNEFIPSGIDNSPYRFPIRTVMSVGNSVKQDILMGKCNIAFTYEMENETGDNKFETDIKWEGTGKYIELFIAQIIKMCLHKAMSLGYDNQHIEFLYFTPLSLAKNNKKQIEEVWNRMKDHYGFACSDMTESLAPYYCLNTSKKGIDKDCVMTIDIGGGSVDSSVFENDTYKYSSSAKFGCDVLWSTPRAAQNDKYNPIYRYLKNNNKINIDQSKESLKTILENMEKEESQYSSKHIINLWLSHKLCRDIYADKLKPVYICHLSAILYNAAQLQKAENGKYPTVLSFSGNGSTYLNEVFDKQEIITIASTIFNKVFGEESKEIKIILPTDIILQTVSVSGKQMTAYGGLNASEDEIQRSDENRIYRGTEMKMYKDSCDNEFFKDNWEEIKSSICNNIEEYLKLVADIMKKCQNPNDFNVDYKSLKTNDRQKRGERNTALDASFEDSFKTGEIESSYFFVPVEQIIYDLEDEILNSENNK